MQMQLMKRLPHRAHQTCDTCACARSPLLPFFALRYSPIRHNHTRTQVQHSLLDRRPDNGMAAFAQAHNIALLPYGVVGGGFLSDKYVGVSARGVDVNTYSKGKYASVLGQSGGWGWLQQLLQVRVLVWEERAEKLLDASMCVDQHEVCVTQMYKQRANTWWWGTNSSRAAMAKTWSLTSALLIVQDLQLPALAVAGLPQHTRTLPPHVPMCVLYVSSSRCLRCCVLWQTSTTPASPMWPADGCCSGLQYQPS